MRPCAHVSMSDGTFLSGSYACDWKRNREMSGEWERSKSCRPWSGFKASSAQSSWTCGAHLAREFSNLLNVLQGRGALCVSSCLMLVKPGAVGRPNSEPTAVRPFDLTESAPQIINQSS